MDVEDIRKRCAPAPLDSREEERLLALQGYRILDTEPEAAFDRLTSIARALFGTSIVLISLLDEHRQFFKSKVGVQARETSRDSSFCAWAVLGDEPFVVLDAAIEDRFKHNPLVVDSPFIRFYAGAPLIAQRGLKLGSFCIIDSNPRTDFSIEERALLTQFAALTVDVLEQRLLPQQMAKVEEALIIANERYKLVTRAISDGIWDWNFVSGEFFFSAHLQQMVGLAQVDCWGNVADWYSQMHPLDSGKIRTQLEAFQRSDKETFEAEFQVKHADQTWRWFHTRGAAVRNSEGKLLRLTGASADVTSQRTTDDLTGLHTRLSLLSILASIQDAPASSDYTYALLCIDLDHFKKVNDSFGHDCGDLLLMEAANRIRQSLALRPGDLAARIVGDEFAVLLGDIDGEEEAFAYASRLHAMLETPTVCGSQTARLSASIGVVLVSSRVVGPEQLLHNAGAAMHQAKARGGGQTEIFTQEIREKALARMNLEADLRTALAENKVLLWYQPKVLLSTGQLVGFEALMRWPHPQLGFIPPDQFIPLAEQSDLILEIGRWTLRESMRQLADWRMRGLVQEWVSVGVNLSAKQFGDAQLIENLARKLSAYALPPECLELEVTESILITDVERALAVLRRLKNLGVGLALDDFGTGYSSLRYLQSFPFDSLKVDRSFIRDLEGKGDDATITQSIIALGRALNLKVVAEGVETLAQADHLRAMGCELGQGYFFSKPLPPEEMGKHLFENRGSFVVASELVVSPLLAPQSERGPSF